jgi:aspartate 1-decarboxylase
MQRVMMKGKIHRATITEANLDYIGSLTVDEDLLERADILPYEQVHVVNINNGERLVTYAIKGERGSGVICLNGAAAHKGSAGDLVIVIAYGEYSDEESRALEPSVVFVDEKNRPIETVHPDAAHSQTAAEC